MTGRTEVIVRQLLADAHKLDAPTTPVLQLYSPPEPVANQVPRPARVAAALFQALRPQQWIKNTACLAGLIFSGALYDGAAELAALAATAMFCAAASSVYILNDLCDRKTDRLNPRTAGRPIASGMLPVPVALAGCLGCLAVASALAAYLGLACAVVLGVYLLMNLAYCFRLKHSVLADVMVIALGFVFRVLAGVYAIEAQPTAWIVLCIFFLALFLAVAKRRAELASLKELAGFHRPVLANYSLPFLDVLLAMNTTMTLVCYALYTVGSPHRNTTLIVTIPPVAYGIGRFLLLVMVRDHESAEDILTSDKGLIAAVVTWVSLCVLIIYGNIHLFE
jgi:4-hydroxybenzoate polyprenyltransferase